MDKSERVRAAITTGFGNGPALMCSKCEAMIDDFVLGQTLEYLEKIAQSHRCDETNWREGENGQ